MEKLVFKKLDGTLIEDVNQYVKSWVKENPFGTVTIGCDSQEFARHVKYAVVIVMHRVDRYEIGHGCHLLISTIFDKDIKAKSKRRMKDKEFDTTVLHAKLWKEVELTVLTAQMLDGCTKKIKIHLDYNSNENEMSNALYESGIGYARSMGYEAFGKPYSTMASITADHFCR